MVLLFRAMLWVLGCAFPGDVEALPVQAAPPSSEAPVVVRGPTERCRASYVYLGPVYEQAESDGIFRQYKGTLDGADFGACTLMGPTALNEWLWVVMSWEPGFRGELSCWIGTQRSPTLQVIGSDGPVPEQIKIKYLFMDAAAAAARVIPSGSEPCPDLSPEDAEPPGRRFQ